MIRVIFKDMEKSELAKEAVTERISSLFERFPDLQMSHVSVTLSMENSPLKAGPDLFTVKIHCRRGRYKGVILKKSAPNLYVALAEVIDHMLERLNRFGDRHRVKLRKQARQIWDFPKAGGDGY